MERTSVYSNCAVLTAQLQNLHFVQKSSAQLDEILLVPFAIADIEITTLQLFLTNYESLQKL